MRILKNTKRLSSKNKNYTSRVNKLIVILMSLSLTSVLSARKTSAEPAPIIIDGSTSTSVTEADNGVRIINVAKPNSDGVSRNTYSDFNVNSQGVILNNADNIGVSQLGGAIIGNTNYAVGDGASIILNEVSSNNISNLNGYIETFGKQAEFILANPNGITCNGCGFINTSRATLITGNELNPNGAVGLFGIGNGSVSITGAGLNGKNLSALEIISRAVKIQAALNVKNALTIKTGNNEYSYTNKLVSSNSVSDIGFAIDASLLGSMYAGQIELISTQVGVGVRSLGTLSALQDIKIDSAANVDTNILNAGTSITIDAANTIAQSGQYLARDLITLNADALSLNANIESDQFLLLTARNGDFISNGNLKSGSGESKLHSINGDITLNGSVFSAGSLSLTGENILNNNLLAARGNVIITSTGDLTNASNNLIYSGKDLLLTIDGTINNNGDLYAGYKLIATNNNGSQMAAFINKGGRVESGSELIIKATQITNSHNFSDNSVATTSSDKNKITILVDTPAVQGIATWIEKMNPAMKRGLIQSGGDMLLDTGTGGKIENTLSDIYATGSLNIQSDAINNNAILLREAVMKITSQWVVVGKKCRFAGTGCYDVYGWADRPAQIIQNTTDNIPASIQSGSALTLTTAVNGVINNSVKIQGNIRNASISGSVNDPLTNLTLPGEGGFFKPNPAPNAEHPYLIETNPLLIDLSQYYGSDYFLEQTGIGKTGDGVLFLGDAYYEQRLIAKQIRLLTGQRYLLNAKDDNEQYKKLADAAASERERLGLEIGVALSLDQQDGLQENILWYVETTVGDKTVLVPRLYLTKITRTTVVENKAALIQGQEITLDTGNVMNEGAIISDSALHIKTEDQLTNRGGSIIAGTTLSITSGGELISESTWWNTLLGADVKQEIARRAIIKSGGTMTLDAQGDIMLIASDIDSEGKTKISSDGDLSLTSLRLENKRNWRDSKGQYNYTNTKVEYALTKLKSDGNLVLTSVGDMLLEGSDIDTLADASVSSGGELNMLAVKNSDDTTGLYTDRKRWSKITQRSRKTSQRYRSATLTAKNNIYVSSQDDVVIFASKLKAGNDINLQSNNGNIAIVSGVDSDFEKKYYSKKGFSYSKKNENGKFIETLITASLSSAQNIHFITGVQSKKNKFDKNFGNIIISGAEITSKGDMTFGGESVTTSDGSRVNNLILNTIALNDKTWSFYRKQARGLGIVGKVLTGGELLRIDKVADYSRNLQGSNAQSGGDFIVNSQNDIKLIAATITAQGKGKFDALGDIDIISALNRKTRYEEHVLAKSSGISFDWDGSRASVGIDADYSKTVLNQTKFENQLSVLNFGDDLSLLSENDILISSSTLQTLGSLTVDAKKSLSIMSAEDILQQAESLTKAQARASVGVGNSYLDFAQSIVSLNAAKNKVRQAKRELAAFNAEINQMQADFKKGLVTKDDIRLRTRDKKYYVANVALAAANLVNSAVQVSAAGSAAGVGAVTSVGTGFYVDVKFEINGSKTKKILENTQRIASNLIAAKDVNLTATDDILISGSNISAKNNVTLKTDSNLLIEAALNENNSTTQRNAFNASMSFGTNGVNGGIKNLAKIFSVGSKSFGLGASTGFDRNTSSMWSNSNVVAGKKISINTSKDTDIVGATVQAEDIELTIGGDLTVQSRQNTVNSRGSDFGIKIGSNSSGLNFARRDKDRRWVDDITRLIGSKSVAIETQGKTSLVGAVIAQIDKDGVDGDNLNIKTTSFESKNLIDFDRSSNFSMGISSSLFGVNKLFQKNKNKAKVTKASTEVTNKNKQKSKISNFYKEKSSLKLLNSGYVRGQNTLATLGKGKVSSWDDKPILLASLNRDINSLKIVTENRKSGGLNVAVSIDHRMLSKKGWKDITKDTKATIKNIRDISKSIATVITDEKFGIQNLGQVIKTNIINTKLDDILSRKNNKLLNAIKSKNQEKSLKALRQFSIIVQNELGLNLNKILFYDSNKTTSSSLKKLTILGAYITGKSQQKGNIFINTGGILTKERMIKTLLHEIYEQEYAAGRSYLFFKTKYKKKENLADFSGNNFISRLNKETVTALENTSQQERFDIRNSKEVKYGTLMANQVGASKVEYRRLHIKEIELIDKRAVDFAKILKRLPRYRSSTGRHDGRPHLRPTKNYPVLPPTKAEIIEAKRRLYKAALRAVSGDYQYKYKKFFQDLPANKFLNALTREKRRSGKPTVNGKRYPYPLYARRAQINLAEQLNKKATQGVVWFQSTPWQRFNSTYKDTFNDGYFRIVKGKGLNVEKILTGKGFEFEFPEYQLKPVVKQAYDLISSGKNYGVNRVDLTQENRAGKKRVMQSNAAKDSIVLVATGHIAAPLAVGKIIAVARSSFGAYAVRHPIAVCKQNVGGCRELFEFGIGFIPGVAFYGLPSSGFHIKTPKIKIPNNAISISKPSNNSNSQLLPSGIGVLSQILKVLKLNIPTAKIIKVNDKIFDELNNSNKDKESEINRKQLEYSLKKKFIDNPN